jgi:hypothetical protein
MYVQIRIGARQAAATKSIRYSPKIATESSGKPASAVDTRNQTARSNSRPAPCAGVVIGSDWIGLQPILPTRFLSANRVHFARKR